MEKELIAEMDSAHNMANQALQNKDFDGYMSVFSNDLQYKQLNGAVIGKDQLTKDVQFYFSRIRTVTSDYLRKEFTIIDSTRLVEKLIQHSKVSIRVFIFFSKNWTVTREGIYEWKKENGAWKITKVTIIAESST